MKKFIFIILLILLATFFIKPKTAVASQVSWWSFRSIDTMKYSRDLAREKLRDNDFKTVIDNQVKAIAETGASHVAIATPYDEEFLPFLTSWVQAARKYHLKVWFRGNWSGWENWFGYPKISRIQHLQKTNEFIAEHPDLFQDGDIFSACPECEMGGPGDPRQNGDVVGHRQFLIEEYAITKASFKQIGKDVQSNYNSMNGDVASLIMDKKTTLDLGGIVVIDHYVATPEKLAADIKKYAEKSGGKVVLGEFGAPIPDINGKMTPEEQADWVNEAMQKLLPLEELVGMNYWVNTGGSTQLWEESGAVRPAVAVLRSYFLPPTYKVTVMDNWSQPIGKAKATYLNRDFIADSSGVVSVPFFDGYTQIKLSATNHSDKDLNVEPGGRDIQAHLEKIQLNWLDKLKDLVYKVLHS